MDYGGIKVHRHEILPPHFFGLVSCLGSHDLVCPLFRNIFSYSMEVMSFLCSLWRRVKVPFSGAVRSEIAHCALCHHPMSRATRSVFHPLSRSTSKNIMNQSPYWSYTTIKCPKTIQVNTKQYLTLVSGETIIHQLFWVSRKPPPVVLGDGECHHLLSRARQKFNLLA